VSQYNPSVYGDLVVWQDRRNGNDDIFLANVVTNETLQVTTDPKDQRNPWIWGDRIVWEDWRNGDTDVYLYTISTGKEERLTTDAASPKGPRIWGDRVVWEDSRNGNADVYLYPLEASSTPGTTATGTGGASIPLEPALLLPALAGACALAFRRRGR
jgi:beta propeller repeat protein